MSPDVICDDLLQLNPTLWILMRIRKLIYIIKNVSNLKNYELDFIKIKIKAINEHLHSKRACVDYNC